MQVCTSLQTDNTPAPHHSVFTGRMPFLPPDQQRQSTEGMACGLYMEIALRECEPNSTQGVCGLTSSPPMLLSPVYRSFHPRIFYQICGYSLQW